MLVLTLREGERVALLSGEEVVGGLNTRQAGMGSKVKLAVSLPQEVKVLREKHLTDSQRTSLREIFQGIKKERTLR
tara:strand:- start:292 stop:519 length:228 start_codon:yes stop_codon:yes gene_type:complete